MEIPSLIIVTGPPGAGKTTLARRLAADLGLPLLYKDGIKERLFESLGATNRAWSRELGKASVDLLLYLAEEELAVARSVVIESNFWTTIATKALVEIQARHPYRPLQIHLSAKPETLLARFEERDALAQRHPGHAEPGAVRNLLQALDENRHAPLDIGGTLFEIDTTDFESLNYEALLHQVKAHL